MESESDVQKIPESESESAVQKFPESESESESEKILPTPQPCLKYLICCLPEIVCVFDQAIYEKATRIICNEHEKYKNIVVRMGEFHMCMNLLGTIGNRFQDAGLKEVAVESGIDVNICDEFNLDDDDDDDDFDIEGHNQNIDMTC